MRNRLAPSTHSRPCATECRGFTLVELMITLTVLAAVMVVLMTVIYAAQRSKTSTSNRVESIQGARVAIDMLARDLRSAGYGADLDWAAAPQPAIAYIDSLQVLINANLYPWPDGLIGVQTGVPQAYQPTGFPRPYQFDGGRPWTPPIKYRRGAETIRWTLDVNNDGNANSLDWQDADGLDAQRTPNPNDYVLVREVYGDSVGNAAGFNWGVTERVALVQRPATAGVPAMFNVFLQGSNTKWNWSDGPIPVSQLSKIERVEVNVTAGSSRPDSKGTFAATTLTTRISSMRNVPSFGVATYNVDGYVFNDNVIKNGQRDAGEPGISGAVVNCGVLSTTTAANGYFLIRAGAGTYTLRHRPPSGYAVAMNPDSFVITVPPAVSHSFADSARSGGWITSFTFNDKNANGTYEGGTDAVLDGVKVTVNPGADVQYTNPSGYAVNFAAVGSYTVSATAPDSTTPTTTNPVTATMSNGGSAAYSFGFRGTGTGTLTGTVYVDKNRNGNLEGNEGGIKDVWVGVSADGGTTVVAWQYSDKDGNFSIVVPTVASPAAPYYIMTIVKPGYYPTSTTSVGPIYVSAGQVIPNNNFGESNYQVITLAASRVLSLTSTNLVEEDWSGGKTNEARVDQDLVLGADATGADQISVWFNNYDNAGLFQTHSDASYVAQASVLSIAADTLNNTATWRDRPDVVTGTQNASGGNFFVWLTQNTKGNYGYLPASASLSYRTQDMGDVQSVLTYDCAGGAMPDLIVGTKSPTANQGTIEVWQNSDASSVAFTRQEIYPPNGLIPGNALGEVTAMSLCDFDGDEKDLVVGTKRGTYSGQLLFFKFVSRVNGARFVYQCGYDLPNDAVTSIACFDIDGDGLMDAIAGTQSASNRGNLQQWGNKFSSPIWSFAKDREVSAPGVVLSLGSADFGGSVRGDLAVGYRADMSNYVGGVRIYFCDTNKIPAFGSDPSGGTVDHMVPALTIADYNYGVYPALPSPPYFKDLATGVKIDATTGALVVYIR